MSVAPSGAISIDGSWKQANVTLTIDDSSGAHNYGHYEVTSGYIFHGKAAITP